MKQTLKENGGLPPLILWTLSIVAGISVANLYYNQPLLNMIRHDLDVSEFTTNLIAMVTQIGYALGLLFVVPLADMYKRKKIIVTNFALLVLSLLCIATAPNIHIILTASLFTGICSVIPQIFIPIAAIYSKPENKGRNVGLVVSGLLSGILVSRVISGVVGELFGWREMYYIAAVLMVVCSIVVVTVLPDIRPTFKGKYADLMKSLLSLVKDYPALRIYAVRSGLAFGSFLAMWSCLALVGMLGLCGVAGAMSASLVGKYVRKVGVRAFNFWGCGLILLAWLLLYFGGNFYTSIIAGIIIIDIGMQCIQLSNQSSIFELCPAASNRVNTIFMTTYFVGGSLGTFLSGTAWQLFGWAGTAGVGVFLCCASLLVTLLSAKKI